MEVISPQTAAGKKVILRLDIDVPLRSVQGKLLVGEDFRLRAGLPTLKLCLENAEQVIIIGHVGRPSFVKTSEGKPEGQAVKELSVKPIQEWFASQDLRSHIGSGKLKILENLRFDSRESFDTEQSRSAQDKKAVMEFARELASLADVFVNEAFASYRPAVSTTVLPTLLPHFAGLRFTQEVKKLREVRDNPKKPFIAIMGGAKVADKLPVIKVLAQRADAVLVGGKLVKEFSSLNPDLIGINSQFSNNILLGKLNGTGTDISSGTIESWKDLISTAASIVWNGPLGKFEDPKNNATQKIAEMVLDSGAEIVTGGGDTIAALNQYGLLPKAEQRAFVSVGGGAMLKFLVNGTLPTIEAL